MEKYNFKSKLHETCEDNELRPALKFVFSGASGACRVTAEGYGSQIGIIMPTIISDTLFG